MAALDAETISGDFIIIGGGTAGLMAGILLKQKSPRLTVFVLEKANGSRSGCLAMGLNAVNLYLTDGDVDAYVDYVAGDTYQVFREDLVRSIAERVNKFVPMLESFGVPFPRDETGDYLKRSRRSILMNGEQIKPLLYKKALSLGVKVVNHTPVFQLLQDDTGRAIGAAGFNLRSGRPVRAFGRAVLIATGGASGIYRPCNPGTARKKTWYSPYNAGSGMAMGFRIGAEMTSFEMRFIALRTKDIIAPTGTLVLGTRVQQLNARANPYLQEARMMLGRPLNTCERLQYQLEENRQGRGPCVMDLSSLSAEQYDKMVCSYMEMSPALALQLLENPEEPVKQIEVSGSEPYINGGHGMAGFWVSPQRQTSVQGLYAAGDTVGGAPKKYITGCFAEAEMAVEHFLFAMPEKPVQKKVVFDHMLEPLHRSEGLSHGDVEERLQKIMDEYAGGFSMDYGTNKEKLTIARRMLESLAGREQQVKANNPHQLMKSHEVKDRILLARVLVEHLLERKETRWPVYQSRMDYPVRNDIEYRIFINSRLRGNKIELIKRSLDAPYKIEDPQHKTDHY